jgi:hypothetical protein
MKTKRFDIKCLLYLAGCFVFFLGLLFFGSTIPFVGYNAWNYNAYSLIAHNYVQFGYFETKLGPILSVSRDLPIHPLYYLNHPQLLEMGISFLFHAFGESFFTSRLLNIIASFVSCVVFFLIALRIQTKRFAFLVLTISVLLPGASLFGKMIGQESVLLMFVGISIYTFLRYLADKRFAWFIASCVSLILGTLTDWPMTYFAVSFSVFLVSQRKVKEAVTLVLASCITALFFLYYSFLLTGSEAFLLQGFLNRSLGTLLQQHNWGLLWIKTLTTRLLFYFNPAFVLFSVGYFFFPVKRLNSQLFYLIISFLIFGVLHIVLYPEGSFGHPYWMYYLTPFVVFASAATIQELLVKNKAFVYLILILSLCAVILINIWKQREIEGNLFRYHAAQEVSKYIPPYAPIFVNRSGFIDPDLFSYPFLYNVTILNNSDNVNPHKGKWLVYSCIGSCEKSEQIGYLKEHFSSRRILGNDLEIWLFDLSDSQKSEKLIMADFSQPTQSSTAFGVIYRHLLQFSSAPQL